MKYTNLKAYLYYFVPSLHILRLFFQPLLYVLQGSHACSLRLITMPLITNYQLPVTDYQSLITNYQVTHRERVVFKRLYRKTMSEKWTILGRARRLGPNKLPEKGSLSINQSTKDPRGLNSPGEGP